MGIGGALVMPATLSILVNSFPSHERAKAIAIWVGHRRWRRRPRPGARRMAGRELLVGIGVRHQHAGRDHRPRRSAPTSCRPARIVTRSKLDPVGALLSMAGLGLFVYGLIEAPHWGWASTTEPRS